MVLVKVELNCWFQVPDVKLYNYYRRYISLRKEKKRFQGQGYSWNLRSIDFYLTTDSEGH